MRFVKPRLMRSSGRRTTATDHCGTVGADHGGTAGTDRRATAAAGCRAPRLTGAAGALVGVAATLIALATPAAPAPDSAAWQSVDSIRRAAERHALDLLGPREGASVEAVAVDDRLKLPLCSEPLGAASQGPFANGRGTVAVSCGGGRAWRLFVPVRTSYEVAVVVAARSLQRGDVLAAEDLRVERRRSTTLPYQYMSRIEDAVGFTVRRTQAEGSLVAPAALEKADAVTRGALVTLVAARGGIMVSTEGVAMENAALGDRVRVRTPVGRVVEGVVESASRVRVGG